MRLTWDPSPDPEVTGYILWYGTQTGVYTNATAVGNVVITTTSNLVAGVTYYFVVTAHDGFGLESEPSNEVSYEVPIIIPEPEPNATTRGYVTGLSLGTPRNDFSGFVGMQIVVGSTPITVTSLGRMKFNGNNGTHTVKLVRASDGLDVPGAYTVVNMATGIAGQFTYSQLAAPVTLPGGGAYYLLSQETEAGDVWAEFDTTVTTTSVASIPSAAWGYSGGPFYPWGAPGHTYVPVDFKYTLPGSKTESPTSTNYPPGETGFVAGVTPGSWRNDYSGFVGMNIKVGTNPITVNSLGRMCVSGNNETHLVKLVRALDGSDVPGGSVLVGMSSGTAGQFQYGKLPNPVVLSPNTGYYIVSQETAGGDGWYDYNATIRTTSVASHPSAVWGTGPGKWYPWGASGQTYVPVDFLYATPGPGPATPTDTSFVTGVTPGTWRNDFSGFVGMNIKVGTNPITVNSLGRMCVSGNNETHLVKLVRALDGSDVPGGSVLVGMSSGTAGQFQYGRLPNPVVLSPNTGYYIVSQETAGGDGWYDYNATIRTTSVASHPSAVWGTGPGKWYPWGASGQTYVPVDFLYTTSELSTPSPVDTSFVTGLTLGTMRNDFSGYVGLSVRIGAQPVTITSVGRMKFNGNTGTHTVKLVRATDGQDVPGASTVIHMTNGVAGQFTYGQLTAPVTLSANTGYYLLSQEVKGGDAWAEYNTTVTTTSIASIPSAAWGYGPGQFYSWGGPGNTYVPVDFKYTLSAPPPEASFVTGQTLGTPRNNFSGYVGMNLVVGSQPLTVTALGRFKLSGNSGSHQVKLVRASDGADVAGASITVDLAGGTAGQYQYARLASPVVLPAGTAYYLLSQETQGGDYWYEYNTQVTTTGVAVHPSAAWGYQQGQWYQWGGPGQSYVPVNFKYLISQ